MNASELADYLLNFIMMIEDYDESKHENAATMLRQQYTSLISDVEVIERLAKEIQVKDEAIFNSEKQAYNLAMQVQNQKFEIEALKAHPVNPYKVITDTKIEPTVVSYTHPIKELTDEEILELTKDSSIFEYREFDDDLVRFARAILRKAQ